MKAIIIAASLFSVVVSIVLFSDISIAGYSQEIYQTQLKLKEMGYKIGSIDGILGRMTETAIEKYQKDNGLEATGKLDNVTKQKLGIKKYDKRNLMKPMKKENKTYGNTENFRTKVTSGSKRDNQKGKTIYFGEILHISPNEIKMKQGIFKITDKTKFCVDKIIVTSYEKIKNIQEGSITVDSVTGLVSEINNELPTATFKNGSFNTEFPDCYTDKNAKSNDEIRKAFLINEDTSDPWARQSK
jgi:peptidoglycan hydrolase-like protein with peptidoglycan-binding domain